jgi:SAM-dependent methyltransferase
MPTVSENLEIWSQYDWPDQGNVWSRQFGGTEALWSFALYPRIQRFLPASSILEIAPGYGRWTQFLQRLCQSMVAVDISSKCIEHCKNRFAGTNHIHFYVNDGSSLAVVPDGSVDFVFSFDSLVHAEKDVLESYLLQLAVKLNPNGVGFFHHSNIGAYPGRLAILKACQQLPVSIRKHILREDRVERLLSINSGGLRAASMTAGLFREYCGRAGLRCVSQELINWVSGKCLIDAISVFTRRGSQWDKEYVCLENDKFVESAILTGRLARLYSR